MFADSMKYIAEFEATFQPILTVCLSKRSPMRGVRMFEEVCEYEAAEEGVSGDATEEGSGEEPNGKLDGEGSEEEANGERDEADTVVAKRPAVATINNVAKRPRATAIADKSSTAEAPMYDELGMLVKYTNPAAGAFANIEPLDPRTKRRSLQIKLDNTKAKTSKQGRGGTGRGRGRGRGSRAQGGKRARGGTQAGQGAEVDSQGGAVGSKGCTGGRMGGKRKGATVESTGGAGGGHGDAGGHASSVGARKGADKTIQGDKPKGASKGGARKGGDPPSKQRNTKGAGRSSAAGAGVADNILKRPRVSVTEEAKPRAELCATVEDADGIERRIHVVTLTKHKHGDTFEADARWLAKRISEEAETKNSILKLRDSIGGGGDRADLDAVVKPGAYDESNDVD
jgi:hypothetical protein